MPAATDWSFSGSSSRVGLRMGAEKTLPEKRCRTQRQSPGAILFHLFHALPICASAALTIWSPVRHFAPSVDGIISVGWAVGLLTMLLAVGWAVAAWLCCSWQVSDGRLLIRCGIFVRRESSIRLSAIQSVETERTVFTAMVGCVRLRISTADRQSDELLLRESGALLLAAQLTPSGHGRTHCFRSDRLSLWLAALGGEGLAAFCSAMVPILSAVSDAAGHLLESELAALVRQRGLLIAGVILFSLVWLLKITHTLATRSKMSFRIVGNTLILHRGVISRRTVRTSVDRICALDMRVSLSGLLLGRQSCSVLLAGNHSYPMLLPVDSRRLRIETAFLSPHGERVCCVYPVSSGVVYAAGRWLACLSMLPAVSLLRRLLPAMSATVPVVGAAAAVLLLWRALITTVSASRAKLELFTDCMELTGVRSLSMHTLRVFRRSVGIVRITQSPLSRILGRCTVRVTPRGNRRAKLSCIKLPPDRVLAVCERMM